MREADNYMGDHESLPGEKVATSEKFWATITGEFDFTAPPWDMATTRNLRDNETNLI